MNKYIVASLLMLFSLAGCTLGGGGAAENVPPVGFYKTIDDGEVWSFRSSILTTDGERRTFAGTNIISMTVDPNNSDIIYIGTDTKGILYSLDGGEGWLSATPEAGVVNAIEVDPISPCTVYAAIHNKIFKTTDCLRSWRQIHLSSLEGEFFTAIAIDNSDPRIVYLGTSRGAAIKSSNAGFSWQAINFFQSRITELIVNPKDPNFVYTATIASGIFRSPDKGITWNNLLDLDVQVAREELSGQERPLVQFRGSNGYLDIAFDYTQSNGLIYTNNYGIFRLLDTGIWQEIFILNKPAEEQVLAIDVNPFNGQEIVFTTNGAYYRTVNNGIDWTVKTLPGAGLPNHLIVHRQNGRTVYVGYILPR